MVICVYSTNIWGTGILTILQASSLNGLHGEEQGVVTTKTELLGDK